jgi:alkaline phosphatase
MKKHLITFIVLNISILSFQNILFAQKKDNTASTTNSTKTTFKKRPKNIILMIGDGMGTSQVYAGLVAKKDNFNISRCKYIGFHKTYSADNFITDSAAGATAFSAGQKTYNGAIGVDVNKKPLPTILEMSEQQGLATGLVATSSITHATPAAFIAHQAARSLEDDIANDFLKTDIDVFIGGGRKFFETRADNKNISQALKDKNYQILYDLESAKKVTTGKLGVLLAPEGMPKMQENRGNMLPDATEIALNILKQNKKGFFVMIEGSQIDWGGHNNDKDYIVAEMIDFDNAVGKALDFADKNPETLVIITADHETGGFAITGGNIAEGTVEGKFMGYPHTGVMVPVFAYGAGAEAFMGIYENTEIFEKMKNFLIKK